MEEESQCPLPLSGCWVLGQKEHRMKSLEAWVPAPTGVPCSSAYVPGSLFDRPFHPYSKGLGGRNVTPTSGFSIFVFVLLISAQDTGDFPVTPV